MTKNRRLGCVSLALFLFAFPLTACQSGGSSSGIADSGAAATSSASISLVSPAEGSKAAAQDATVRATFSKPMNPSSMTPGTFQVYFGVGLANQLPGAVSYDASSQTAEFQPAQQLKSGSFYTAVLTTAIEDAEGLALSASKTWTFQVKDSIAPKILSVTPACGTTYVSPSTPFCVEFSEALNPATLLPGCVALFKETPLGELPTPGTAEMQSDGRTVCFVPDGLLSTDASYSLALSASIADFSGNELGFVAPCSVTTVETVKPFVTEVFPAPSATKIKTDTTIRATVSEALNPFTIGPDSLRLFDSTGAPVEAALVFDEASYAFTLTPAAKLKVYSPYTVSISPSLEDLSGNPLGAGPALGASTFWGFQTAGWEAPVLVEHADGVANSASEPQSAVNQITGEVWAVWTQTQPGDAAARVYCNRNPSSGDWLTESPISNGTGPASAPQIAIGLNGNPWSVWVQKDSASGDLKDNIYLSSFDGNAWAAPSRVSTDAGDASAPRIVVDGDGIPYVAWLEKIEVIEGTATKIYTVVYANHLSGNPGSWGNKTRLSFQKGNAASLELAIDRTAKRVYAIFTQKNTETTPNDAKINAYANLFDAGAWAATPSKLSDDVNDATETKILAFPSSGNALAAWLQKVAGTGGTVQPHASFFTGPDPLTGTPGSWATQVKISDKTGASSQLRLVGSPNAEIAVAAWRQKAGDTFENFWSSVFLGSWNAQKRIGDNKGNGDDLSLFFEPASSIVYAAWLRQPSTAAGNEDQAVRVYSSSLQILLGKWEESLAVSPTPSDTVQVASAPRLAAAQVGAGRRIVAIWARLVSPAFLVIYGNLEGSSYQE